MKNYKTIIALVGAGLACSAATSQANLTVLTPGSGLVPISTTADATPLGSAVVTSAYANGILSGTIKTWVLTGDSFGDPGYQGLVFVYQVNETGPDSLETVALNGFGGLGSVEVAYAGSNKAPGFADLSQAGTVNFSFSSFTGISDLLYVYTSATVASPNIANIIDSTTATGNIQAPVPEPSTIVAGALLLLPFGVGVVRSLRKDRTA